MKKYILAVRVSNQNEIFEFPSETARQACIDEIYKKFPNVEYMITEMN